MEKYFVFPGLFFVVIFSVDIINAVSIEQDLVISSDQKLILDKFRKLVQNRLPFNYMNKDIYLIRWLRARKFNIRDAERMLMENLEWRENNRMDSIMEEDFSDLELNYPYYINTYQLNEKTGVLAYVNVGTWDVRAGVLQGKLEKLMRYLDRYLEKATSKVRDLQESGFNITQFDLVFNMDKFSFIQHYCLQCIPALPRFILSYETYYPNSCNRTYILNTPAAFDIVLNGVKGVLSPVTRDSLQICGTNKALWQPKLFREIPRKYLPLEIGGDLILDD